MGSGYRERDGSISTIQRCIVDLAMDKPYPVLRAESVVTKYGLSILTILESEDLCLKMFLPRRYSLCSEKDIKEVNEQTVHYRLIYKGLSSTSRSYILQIESASLVSSTTGEINR
jgi:hypothetical protein